MKVTFEELRQQVALFAAAMRKMGVRRGDRVVGGYLWLLSPWEQGNGWEEMQWSWVRLFMALCIRVLHKLDQEGPSLKVWPGGSGLGCEGPWLPALA